MQSRWMLLLYALIILSAILRYQERERENMTPAQQEAKQAQEVKDEENRNILSERCKIIRICKKFSESRQNCATAGNYNLCLNIKLGNDYNLTNWVCTPDGKPKLEEANIPSRLDCLLN